jgi:chromosome segregation ATPase
MARQLERDLELCRQALESVQKREQELDAKATNVQRRTKALQTGFGSLEMGKAQLKAKVEGVDAEVAECTVKEEHLIT